MKRAWVGRNKVGNGIWAKFFELQNSLRKRMIWVKRRKGVPQSWES